MTIQPAGDLSFAAPGEQTARRAILLLLGTSAALLALLGVSRLLGADAAVGALAGALLLALAAAGCASLWPALPARAHAEAMAPLIALVGCDGAGKSTLAADLLADPRRDAAMRSCYLGLGSGAMGARIGRVPLLGAAAEKWLAGRATRTRTPGEVIPGLATAIAVYLFSLARLRRFKRMLGLRRAGIAVITDRYPQIEVAGFYDGPGLSAARAGSRPVAALARAERRLYEWMAGFVPDVVIRLNIDAATAHARKPDHAYDLLARKVAATSRLRFNGARIVDLDSRRPYETVRAAAAGIVRRTLAAAAPAAAR